MTCPTGNDSGRVDPEDSMRIVGYEEIVFPIRAKISVRWMGRSFMTIPLQVAMEQNRRVVSKKPSSEP